MNGIESEIMSMVCVQLGHRQVEAHDRLYADLGAESIDLVNLAVALEDRFGVFIPEDTLAEIVRVSDLIHTVKALRNETK